jgi:tetratricopeptide (TPR) repeat protein
MLRQLGTVLRYPVRAYRLARRHVWLSLLVLVAITAGSGIGLWQYGRYQWRAAQAAVKEERTQEARERLARCLRIWPRSPGVHLLAARAARMAGDLSDAEAHLNRCLELQGGPSDEVRLEFLLIRVQSGEIDDERGPLNPLFKEVQEGHPESPLILETIARAYLLRLRYKPAYACLSMWIEREPNNPKPYYWRGLTLERINDPRRARADYDKALDLDPDMIQARLRVAEMLLEDKQAPEALPHLERLMRQAPNDAQVQARMGICRFLQGRTEEARRLMEAAVIRLPHDPALLVALANLDIQDGRWLEAERRLRKVLETDPSDTEALFVLATVLQGQGRTRQSADVLAEYEQKRAAVDRINDLLKDVADSPTATANDYAEIGRLFLSIGRERFGVYWSERALERDPNNQTAHRALAEHYARKGDAASSAAHRRQLREETSGAPKRDP